MVRISEWIQVTLGREMKEPVVSARACVCDLEQQVKFSHREELRDLLL